MRTHASGRAAERFPARPRGYTSTMILVRLTGTTISLDVRVLEVRGRWIASADTTNGPTLGIGFEAGEAIEGALLPFGVQVSELLGSLRRGELR